jgi:hypothetical protein
MEFLKQKKVGSELKLGVLKVEEIIFNMLTLGNLGTLGTLGTLNFYGNT